MTLNNKTTNDGNSNIIKNNNKNKKQPATGYTSRFSPIPPVDPRRPPLLAFARSVMTVSHFCSTVRCFSASCCSIFDTLVRFDSIRFVPQRC